MTQTHQSPLFLKTCPLCDEVQITEQLQLGNHRVMRCCRCDVEFLNPQPDSEVLGKIYSANYFLSERDGIEPVDVARLKRQTAKLYVDQILSIEAGKTGKLLEIGCGNGDFLLEAQTRGFQVSGIETSSHATVTANGRLGAELVRRGEVDNLPMPESAYDVIVFSDVIEHVPDPKMFLHVVHRSLRPGGLVFIVTPSTDSWSRRLMGRQWMEYKLEHLFYFNQKSLAHLLRQCSFTDIEFHSNSKVLSFEYVQAHFRRFKIRSWSPLVETVGRLIPEKMAKRDVAIAASGMVAVARRES